MTEPGDRAQIRRVLLPLIRAGTLLERQQCPETHTLELRGGAGGSFIHGVPYIETGEPWPRCRHDREMGFVVQVDSRDALHDDPIEGLYVVFECIAPVRERFEAMKAKRMCAPLIRHYAHPARHLRAAPSLEGDVATTLSAVEVAEFLPPECLLEEVAPACLERLAALELEQPWGQVLADEMRVGGWRRRLYDDHLGGWHVTNWDRATLPPACTSCGQRLRVVLQLEAGDGNRTLWACPEHPREAHYRFHK